MPRKSIQQSFFMQLSEAQRSQCQDLARMAASQFNDQQAYTDLTTAALQVCDGSIALIVR